MTQEDGMAVSKQEELSGGYCSHAREVMDAKVVPVWEDWSKESKCARDKIT